MRALVSALNVEDDVAREAVLAFPPKRCHCCGGVPVGALVVAPDAGDLSPLALLFRAEHGRGGVGVLWLCRMQWDALPGHQD